MSSIFAGLEKLSLVDFDDKMACTLFTNGCNFRCPFCHNYGLISAKDTLDWKEIKDFLVKRRNMLDAVAVTGGEPTLHPELKDYLKEIKDLGYMVKLDSNGSNPEVLKELIDLKLVDYIAMDVKNGEHSYNPICGVNVNMDKIKESMNILKSSGIKYEFRTTLIKEFHNDESIEEIGKLIEGSRAMYLQKFVLRDACPNQSLHAVSLEDAKKYKEILLKYCDNVRLREYE